MHNDSLQDLLSRTARAHAARNALEWRGRRVSYAELEDGTNRLANYLASAGVAPGSVVALLVDDRLRLIEAVVGVLKAGCAFAPLSLNNPDKRLCAMVRAMEPALFIVEERFRERLAALLAAEGLSARFLVIDAAPEDDAAAPVEADVLCYRGQTEAAPPSLTYGPDDLVYIYFTSGSTGTPKAIAGRQASLLHFIRWEIETLRVEAGERTSQLVVPTFDAFLRDLFVPLCAGATLCIPADAETIIDPARLAAWLDGERINLVHCVPSIFRALVGSRLDPSRLGALRYIVMAGERLHPHEVGRWMEVYGERIRLVNLYGATENTMAKFCHFIERADTERKSIPIGRPIKGAKAIILGPDGHVCDPGTVGEIYIRTPYLTHGYYRQPELTRQVFVRNPFSDDPRDLIHKTGDFGRLLPDGNYELIGRKDHQVKIRGQRVELGEVESVLKSDGSVRDCVASVWGDEPGSERLVAYVVAREGVALDARSLARTARESLPEYMVPTTFIPLDALPLLPNGKIDRRALPAPDAAPSLASEPYAAPITEAQRKLADIWQQVLGAERVGLHDDFFRLGGHSLLATQVISRVREEFKVEVPLRELFEQPTISRLATLIERARAARLADEEGQVLDLVESLSEAELSALLEQLPEGTSAAHPDLTL